MNISKTAYVKFYARKDDKSEVLMMEDYYIINTTGHYELFHTRKPRFRAEVDMGKPDPELMNITWLDNDLTKEECDRCIIEALEYLEKFVLMGE